MKGDFSRLTFDKSKNYAAVLKQQGRVSLDADWNEHIDIIAHQRQERTKDMIGLCGAPLHHGGFEIRHPGGDSKDLLISTGRFYVDGILCELHPTDRVPIIKCTAKDGSFDVDVHPVDGGAFCRDAWVAVCTRETPKGDLRQITEVSPYGTTLTLHGDVPEYLQEQTGPYLRLMKSYHRQQPLTAGEDSAPASQTYLVYLDVWNRHITAIEDSDIRETALGGPDTATRVRTVAQVKTCVLEGVTCSNAKRKLSEEFPPSSGRLTVETTEGKQPEDPCLISEGAGYRGLENRLYRIEIHKGGKFNAATFKWSRDNAWVAYEIEEFVKDDGHKIKVKLLGRDRVLRLKKGDWVEVSGDKTDLDTGSAGTMAKVKDITDRILTLSKDVSAHKQEAHPKVRRWDTSEVSKPAVRPVKVIGPVEEEGFIELEDGIRIKFSGTDFKTGDYWVFPVRVGDEEKQYLEQELPHGVQHHYCPLALVTTYRVVPPRPGRPRQPEWRIEVKDCRPMFPPTTELLSIDYISGDGQEAMPGQQLALPLRVGVSRGRWPVENARVQFTVAEGGGSVSPSTATTGPDGIAQCMWQLGNWNYAGDEPPKQEVKAVLLDANDSTIHLPVYFNANLSVAQQVAYNPAGCDKWDDPSRIETVEDAINSLCKREPQAGGCAVAVHNVATLVRALRESNASANICLLPGTNYRIDEQLAEKIRAILAEKEKKFIKITGCGSAGAIQVQCPELLLQGHQIVLEHLHLNVADRRGAMVLRAGQVTAERCAFVRTIGSQRSGPLVTVRRTVTLGRTEVRWGSNRMLACWYELVPDGFGYWATRPEDIPLSGPGRERLKKLSEIDPHENEVAYIEAREATIKDIQRISAEKRKAWFDRRPAAKIDRLGRTRAKAAAAINQFFDHLWPQRRRTRPALTAEVLRADLDAIAYAFYVRHYNIALALEPGVGGWIEDNVIDGYLALNYGDEYTRLSWKKTTDQQQRNKRAFADKYRNKYLQTLPTILRLQGNRLLAVQSNANSIMEIIDDILKGEIPGFQPQSCYTSMTVTENVFAANGSSFVCGSLIMNGNRFARAASENHIAAFVLGYDGIFVGNTGSVAANEQALIETILVENRTRESANLLQIV